MEGVTCGGRLGCWGQGWLRCIQPSRSRSLMGAMQDAMDNTNIVQSRRISYKIFIDS